MNQGIQVAICLKEKADKEWVERDLKEAQNQINHYWKTLTKQEEE